MKLRDFIEQFVSGSVSEEIVIFSASPFIGMYLIGCDLKKINNHMLEAPNGRRVILYKSMTDFESYLCGRRLSQVVIGSEFFNSLSGSVILYLRTRVRHATVDDPKLRILTHPWSEELREINSSEFELSVV